MIPKEIKYNLQYDDVQGDFLRECFETYPNCTGDNNYCICHRVEVYNTPVRPCGTSRLL